MKKLYVLLLFVFPALIQAQEEATLIGTWNDPAIPGSSFYDNAYNEIWGVVANGEEIAIIGSTLGTHFVSTTNDIVTHLDSAFVPGAFQGGGVVHRDYHDYDGHLFIVCDEGASTLQIVDISDLPNSVELVYDDNEFIRASHNIFIDTAQARMYACGVRRPGVSGFISLQVYDISTPSQPNLLKEYGQIGTFSLPYVHDIYVEDHIAYLNCGGSGFYIIDFTDLDNADIRGSLTSYPQSGYNHSGWLHPDKQYYYMADETHGMDLKVLDVSDPSDIEVITTFNADADPNASIPHNLIVHNDKLYVSYYYDGLQVFDLTDPANPVREYFYDTSTWPYDNNYRGAWGIYPFLPSGNVYVSDMQNGLFVCSLDAGSTNTNELSSQGPFIHTFPQPATSIVQISSSAFQDQTGVPFQLMDLSGRILQDGALHFNGRLTSFALGNQVPSGLFVLQVGDTNNAIVHKLSVQR